MKYEKKRLRRVNGWDARDYKLWSDIMGLPHYGLIANNSANPMLSRQAVIHLLEEHAEARFNAEWNKKLSPQSGKDIR